MDRAIIAFLGLGSNLGDRSGHLKHALRAIAESDLIRLDFAGDVASLHETSPVGFSNQENYLNSVARVETNLNPVELLRFLMSIEVGLGRIRRRRWDSRVIDLDLLLYGDLVINEPDLIIPHPRMHERRFVLEPLVEIAPTVRHPVLGQTIEALADRARLSCPNDRIQRVGDRNWTLDHSIR